MFILTLSCILCTQGDAEYLRYRGMQEFDQAMQHLEEEFGVSFLSFIKPMFYNI